MKIPPLVLLPAAFLAGCGVSETKPVSAAPPSRDALMRRPMTTEERIAAVERSSAPEAKKQAAIARLRSVKR